MPVEHDDFLLLIILDCASDIFYRFAEISTTRTTIESIATRQLAFQEGAHALAADFCRLHRGGARDGAFFVFELGVAEGNVNLYALVKYDYSQALEIVHREGATGLRRRSEGHTSELQSLMRNSYAVFCLKKKKKKMQDRKEKTLI